MPLAMLAVASCANTAASQRDTTPQQSAAAAAAAADDEQRQIEAAKRHPIAYPEPRPLYPEQSPPPRGERGLPEQAPPPRAGDATAPAPQAQPQPQQQAQPQPLSQSAQTNGAATTVDETVVADRPPPEPQYEVPPAAPAVGYVWAPGYWYWYDNHYVWIRGSWIEGRPGYAYVAPRWVYGGGVGWTFWAGGWSLSVGGSVVLPLYRHRFLYDGWPYYRRPYWYGGYGRHYDHHHHHGYDRDRYYRRSWAGQDRHYHDGRNAGRHYDRGHHGATRSYSHPRNGGYHGSGAHRSSSRVSAPPSRASSGGGHRSVPARRR